MHCRIELTARPGPVSQVHQSLAGDLAEDQDLTRPKAAVKRFWYWSLLILFQVLGRAADSQSGALPQQPTEISFEELVRMEVPSVEAASKYKQKLTEATASSQLPVPMKGTKK